MRLAACYLECTYTLIGQEVIIEEGTLARQIAEVASESLATDILVLDIRHLSTITDYFVLGSADNVRQLRAIGENIERELRESGVRPNRKEGATETGWLVLDYDGVIVHLFTTEQRSFYRLEELWADAHRLLMIQ